MESNLPQIENSAMENSAGKIAEKKTSRLPKQQRRALKLLIIFFAAMLAFTILSRAADSLTIPIVEITEPNGKSLEHTLTAEGTVEARKEVSLRTEAELRVLDIPVREGQSVKEGDVLLTFDLDELNEQLESKYVELRQKELELKTEQLKTTKADNDTTEEALLKEVRAKEDYEETQKDADKAIERAELEIQEAQADLKKMENELEKTKAKTKEELMKDLEEKAVSAAREREDAEFNRGESLRQAQRSIDDAWTAAQNVETDENGEAVATDYTAMRRAEENYASTKSQQDRAVALALEKEQKAWNELNKASNGDFDEQSAITAAEQAVETAQSTVTAKERALKDAQDAKEKSIRDADRTIADAGSATEKAKADAKDAQKDAAVTKQEKALGIEKIKIDQEKIEKEIAKLEKMMQGGGQALAPANGVVTKINVTVGAKTTEEAYMLMADDTAGYSFKTAVLTEDAKYVKRGDEANITPAGQNKAIEGATVESISSLSGEQSGKQEIIVALPGDTGELGMVATLKVEKQSDSYNVCVPLNSLYSDGEGDFVLVLREKDSVLGTETVAEKVKVQIIDKDRNNAAVEGGLMRMDQVITRSSKPITSGDRVRLGT